MPVIPNYPTWGAPITKLLRSVRERGWKGMITQLYTIGDIKFGQLKGVDKFGNKYYEDLDQPYGQHRWVEYADIHNPDPTMIQPEWHGWMHHVFDEVPRDNTPVAQHLPTTHDTNAIYGHHVSKMGEKVAAMPTYNLSQYRPRGYKVDSLLSKYEDGEMFYKQPGHPMSPLADKGGRFKTTMNLQGWVPPVPAAKKESK